MARLASIRVSRRSDELLDALRGADAMLVDEWTLLQLWIPATRIGGGTEEALRSIVAERVLGLPASRVSTRTCRSATCRSAVWGGARDYLGARVPGSTAGRFAGVPRRRSSPSCS